VEDKTMLPVALALVLTLMPVPALAQSAPGSGGTELEQRIHQKKPVVRPKPAGDTLTRDANQAVDELSAARRRDEILRELSRPTARRPDLDPDVTGGIQTRGLQRARPR
jgi:hypothetical protein